MPGMERMAPKAFPSARVATIGVAWFVLLVSLGIQARPSAQQPAPQAKALRPSRATLDRYCVTCHNQRLATAELKLDEADVANPVEGAEIWEKVVQNFVHGMMPPPNMPQPSTDDRQALLSWLETSLDKAAAASRIQAARKHCGVSIAPSIKTPSEISCPSTSTPHRSCPPMKAVTASTT